MRSSRLRSTAVLGVALLASGCAARAEGSAPTPSRSDPAAAIRVDPADGGLALQVAYGDGCAPPGSALSGIPLASVYEDGRVITEGAYRSIYPGPALPNVQVSRIRPDRVDALVQQALDAGLGEEPDLGTPSTSDAPWARVTVVTVDGTAVTDVHLPADCPYEDRPPTGLTHEQEVAWEGLKDLVDTLSSIGAAAVGSRETESYQPEAVAAVVTEWVDPDDGLPTPEPVAWPGPALPGEAVDPEHGVHCMTATGAAADAVLAAARTASDITPWTDDQGRRWAVELRPLLPHERSCADLPAA